jgi:hypothetical protein
LLSGAGCGGRLDVRVADVLVDDAGVLQAGNVGKRLIPPHPWVNNLDGLYMAAKTGACDQGGRGAEAAVPRARGAGFFPPLD